MPPPPPIDALSSTHASSPLTNLEGIKSITLASRDQLVVTCVVSSFINMNLENKPITTAILELEYANTTIVGRLLHQLLLYLHPYGVQVCTYVEDSASCEFHHMSRAFVDNYTSVD